jgi:hypothetical protein
MAAVELERDRATERQTHHLRPIEAKGVDERGQHVGIAADAEVLGRLRRASDARQVRHDDGELPRQRFELRSPRGESLADIAVDQHDGWAGALPRERDRQA